MAHNADRRRSSSMNMMNAMSRATSSLVELKPSKRLGRSGSPTYAAAVEKSSNTLISMQPRKRTTRLNCAATASALSSSLLYGRATTVNINELNVTMRLATDRKKLAWLGISSTHPLTTWRCMSSTAAQ
eukprot:4303997-Prymnesium_polylepis.1